MIFHPHCRERERLPVIDRAALGRAIEVRDQVGIMRLLPRDRVRVIEDRGDYALCEHAACRNGLLLIKRDALSEEAAEPSTQEELL